MVYPSGMPSQAKLYAERPIDPFPSPLSEFRRVEGLTQAQMAHLSGVTRLMVLRSEQAVFPQLTLSLLSGMLNRAIITTSVGQVLASEEEIQDAYGAFQRQTRRINYGYLTPDLPNYEPSISPLKQWRLSSDQHGSLVGLAISFCTHPVGLTQVERGLQKTIPAQFVTALLDSGYDEDTLEELQLRQLHFCNHTVKAGV